MRASSLCVEDFSSTLDSLGTDGSLSSRPSSGKSDTAPVPLSRFANEKPYLISPTPFFDDQPSSVLDEESSQSKVPLCLAIDPLNENYSLNSESSLASSQMESPVSSKECAPSREHPKSSSSHRVAKRPSLRQPQRESTPQPPVLFDVFNDFATSDPTDSMDPGLPLQRTEPGPCDVSGEGLVQSMELPGGNVSGVSDLNPVARQIGLLGELFGRTDIKVGLLYTSAETNSVYQIGLAIEACRENGFSYVEKGIGDINDIQAAFMSLSAEGVDAIYIPTDNTLANACATLYAINTGE